MKTFANLLFVGPSINQNNVRSQAGHGQQVLYLNDRNWQWILQTMFLSQMRFRENYGELLGTCFLHRIALRVFLMPDMFGSFCYVHLSARTSTCRPVRPSMDAIENKDAKPCQNSKLCMFLSKLLNFAKITKFLQNILKQIRHTKLCQSYSTLSELLNKDVNTKQGQHY